MASSTSIGRPVSEWWATIRMSAPSSARTLSVTRSAISLEHAGGSEVDVVQERALAEDRHARGEVRRPDVGDEAGLEALAQALLDGEELAGQAVAGEDELAPGLVEGVERVEELLLGLGLAGEELDVVDEENVGVAVGVLEMVDASASRAR